MKKYIVVLSLLAVPFAAALAAPSSVIRESVAVCDPNSPTHCSAPDSSGSLPVVVSPSASAAIANQASADSVSNYVFTATNKTLYTITVKIGATSGYAMLFDAASLPANGAVTPTWCYPVTSNGTNGSVAATWPQPLLFTTGITAGFSTTVCDTLTASATAKFMGQAN